MNSKVNWEDADFLQQTISLSKSRVEVLKRLGYNHRGSVPRRNLNAAIRKFNLDVSSFNSRTDRWEALPDTINECRSMRDVLRAVGLQDQGDNRKTAKRAIRELGLNTDHFNRTGGSVSPYTESEIFCENSKVTRVTVKRRILANEMLPYKCDRCRLTKWQGETLSLELDHINGINNDNRLINLRFLCPNCHSLTPTHRGKNKNIGV